MAGGFDDDCFNAFGLDADKESSPQHTDSYNSDVVMKQPNVITVTPMANVKEEFSDNEEERSNDSELGSRGMKRKEPEQEEGSKLPSEEDAGLMDVKTRIRIHKLETLESCQHEVAVPPWFTFEPLKPMQETPAKEYKFLLDPFQKEALLCLENSQSVLVSAHTSAGKTVVAEYAIAMALRDKQRVIYTTPIKALSNQKYREMMELFIDVGLMTGDVTINPNASCLIMTTEILRSMLYRGSEVMREVSWVVFDEIHYMRDKERGVVWEETIILLPDTVHYVFLSATIPNAIQFAEWICFLHKQPCHVVYTDYRPTPLQHYLFPADGDGIHLVVDENGEFRDENFETAMSGLKDPDSRQGRRGPNKGESDCYKIVKMIMERNLAPVIVFSFSRKDCELFALQMAKLDFNSDEEKILVEEVFNNAIETLSDDDKKLPQIEQVLPLLKKGIGIHHSGLLPLLKETIEILFGEGLIKSLFATETFAMGLNMPARTVVFTGCRKFDGKDTRWVSSGEYIQMSGRAGRRGIDDKGVVITMVSEKMSDVVCKNILKGQPDPLNSAFHLTYNMVLNLLRVEEINPEYMLERSFFQFQNYTAIPDLVQKINDLESRYRSIEVTNPDMPGYYNMRNQIETLSDEMRMYMIKPLYLLPYLQPGRLLQIVNGDDDFGWGVVVNFQKRVNVAKKFSEDSPNEPVYTVEILLQISEDSVRSGRSSDIRPCLPEERAEFQVVPVMLNLISSISAVRLYIPKDLRSPQSRNSVLRSLEEVKRRFGDGIPLLDPIEDMGIRDEGFKDIVKKIELLEHRMYSHPLHNDPSVADSFKAFSEKMKLAKEVKLLRQELKRMRSLLQMQELRCRKRVLRRLGYCTADDVIEIKGRVACEISSADELVMTELLFNGTFNKLTADECAALLSCFVFQERTKEEVPRLSGELAAALSQLKLAAQRVCEVSKEAKLPMDEQFYLESFRPQLMDLVQSWCLGATFGQICAKTSIFEGSIIRCMRRQEELMREMCMAAKTIGNSELEEKFSQGIKMMKRDIVFAGSLYL